MKTRAARRTLHRLLLGLLARALVIFTACSPDKPKFNAIDITGANYAKRLALQDANGKVRDLTDFKGKVVVVFFG